MDPHKPLRVGFDLDGVILYNPARIARPLIVLFKNLFFHQKKVLFYIPTSKWEKFLYRLIHKTSIFVAGGYEDLIQMIQKKEIEAYIITARYSFMKDDFEQWIQKLDAKKYFTVCMMNKNNEQPHLYKQKAIEKLHLDIFVEDNWDIVTYLSHNTHAKIFWITNIFDRSLAYRYTFLSLRNVLTFIRSTRSK